MCRLYGFRSTHPSPVGCELIQAQNSLLRQSEKDARGLENPDGWGLGLVRDGRVECEREVGPAFRSPEYRKDAASARASTVVAHVRRATVGTPAPENTHPFRRNGSMLVHNGHVGGFRLLQPRFLSAMSRSLRDSIRGSTDSEHFFHLLLSRWQDAREDGDGVAPAPARMAGVLAGTIREVAGWRRELAAAEDADGELALNVLWTVGEALAGSRLGRSLWYVERDGPHRCERHDERHLDPAPSDYRAVALASERITGEEWTEVPEPSVFYVDSDCRLQVEPLELPGP